MYLASVQKQGTLQHLHSIDFAEKFVPLILELPQEDDGVDVLIAAPFCHGDRGYSRGRDKILSAHCLGLAAQKKKLINMLQW